MGKANLYTVKDYQTGEVLAKGTAGELEASGIVPRGYHTSEWAKHENNRMRGRKYNITSQYKDKIDGVMGQLDGMKDFSYDPTRDAAYEQYKNSYTRQAKLANENAQANASAISGGYGSSYGTQAGQSAYQNAMAGLSNATNGLYSQALSQYTQKKSDLQNQLSGYQQAEAQDYEKYQTNYQNWENQRNYYQNVYNQAASESQAKKSRGSGLLNTILSVGASILMGLL